ncbi:MAG: helix-turn-helix domain-containing protein [Solirubrobacteraceae bacterium]|jgi:DNA-binding HxlR family transcriptional regulator
MASLADLDGDGEPGVAGKQPIPHCCPYYHRAVELIGRRWTGAILEILIQGGSLRFSQIATYVTDLSDRMLSDRLKELEACGLVRRTVYPGPPVRVEYTLTRMGRDLAPALEELKRWARAWLDASFPSTGGAGSATPLTGEAAQRRAAAR